MFIGSWVAKLDDGPVSACFIASAGREGAPWVATSARAVASVAAMTPPASRAWRRCERVLWLRAGVATMREIMASRSARWYG